MPRDNADDPPLISPEFLELRGKVEKLSAENLVLKQHLDFMRLFAQHEKTQADQFAEHKKYIQSEITKRLVAMTLVGLVVLGIAWYQTITPIRKTVQERLDKEFASDNIRTSISEAAQKAASAQAKSVMETTIKPATDQALADIRQHRDEVSAIAQQMKQDTKAIAGQLHTEVSQQAAQEKLALESLRSEYTKEVGELKALVTY